MFDIVWPIWKVHCLSEVYVRHRHAYAFSFLAHVWRLLCLLHTRSTLRIANTMTTSTTRNFLQLTVSLAARITIGEDSGFDDAWWKSFAPIFVSPGSPCPLRATLTSDD